MTLGKYLFLMALATLLCWGALALVVFFVDPESSGNFGILIFFLAVFFAITGTAALLGFLLRHFFQPHEFAAFKVKNSFRQGIWLGLIVVITLYLFSQDLAAWWNLLILILFFSALEIFFVGLRKEK
jgi:hypothetical protein